MYLNSTTILAEYSLVFLQQQSSASHYPLSLIAPNSAKVSAIIAYDNVVCLDFFIGFYLKSFGVNRKNPI